MTDRELNRRLALLCGEVLVESNASGRWLLVNPPDGCLTVWNPVDDWRQVHKYVIPALLARHCDVNILHSSNLGDSVEVTEWDPSWKMPDEDLSRRAAAKDGRLTPRLVCEAVLEAIMKLEKKA